MPTGVVSVKKIQQVSRVDTTKNNISLENSNLFVLIGANRFSYFITSYDKQVLLSNTIDLELNALETIFESNQDLQHQFNQVKVAFQNPFITLVPNMFYNETDASTYLEKSFSIPQQHYLLTDNLLTFQCQNVYLAPIETYNLLLNKYTHVEFQHIATVLLAEWQQKAVQFKNKSVFINVNKESFQIGAFNRHELLIWNTYNYKTAKDFLYFVLLVFKQLELNVELEKVLISGQITEGSEIYKLLHAYIRNVEFLSRTTTYHFASDFDLQSNHANFDLFSI